MKTHITPLYKKSFARIPMHVKCICIFVALLLPYHTLSNQEFPDEPFEQKFIITAYYSPEPGQCCYVRGGLGAERVLNGQGIAGADSTKVYPGMIAAPAAYPFGTKISLPGLGTFEVHDRGGAITKLANGAHRLDIWVGHGEEGLARALAFGIQSYTGTVYPTSYSQPETQFDLATLPSPIDELRTYFVEKDNFVAMRPKIGDRGLSVYLLQDHLQAIGYLHHTPTGFFGEQTSIAFQNFLRDFQVDAPRDFLSETSAAFLVGARNRLEAKQPLKEFIDQYASAPSITEAKRMLRFLGYFDGRTNGTYDDALFAAILQFQKDHGLVGTKDDPGAGRIGPITSTAIRAKWNRTLVASKAQRYLDLYAIDKHTQKRGQRIEHFLGEGYTGKQVKLLQNALAALGFFPQEKINGVYGPLTKESVLQYQLDRNIVTSKNHTGAGYIGPATLRSLRKDQRMILYNIVRAKGWNAL